VLVFCQSASIAFYYWMFSRPLQSAVATWIMMAFIINTGEAQSVPPAQTAATGILTDRLSAKQLARWRKIERIVLAVDAQGQILHPVLYALWKWADTSGHAIYIEIREPYNPLPNSAGTFQIESLDPTGEHHIAVIRLNLTTIDLAYVGPEVRRPDGLIPFAGLSKEERYAEVLGHELVHAQDILSDPERARLVEEFIEQTNDLILSRIKGPEMRQRLLTRYCLLHVLEKYAETVETPIWRELLAGQPLRNKRRQ